MFENSDLKQKAKAVLKKFGFKLPLLVSFVAGILASDFTKFSSAISENEEQLNTLYENPETAALLSIVMPLIGIIAIFWGIFVAYPIVVGRTKFFMEYRLSGSKFETLFSGFKSGKYLNIVKTMFIMAVATSIDALAVGISLAMAGNVNIWMAAILIGLCTCGFSAAGVQIGNVFGAKYEKKAQLAGGLILIMLGLKILLEHLGVIA